MKPFDKELITGSIIRAVWKLAWPCVLLNVINGLHGFVDHVLVGNFLGYEANAAIGVAWQIFLVIMVFLASLFQGMNILIARYAGKEDRERVSEVAYQTFLSALLILLFLAAPLGYMISPVILSWVAPSEAVRGHALPCLRILFTCSLPLFLLIVLTNALQASGDPKTALKLGILATLIHIALSLILIPGAGPIPELGVAGAALATCLAPLVSDVIAISLIAKQKTIIQLPRRLSLLPDLSIIRAVARIGIPTGLQAMILNLGGVTLIGIIGSLDHSAATQAAYTICYTQLFSLVSWASFGLRAATATFMGQNLGAGQRDRGKAGVHVTAVMGVGWAVIIGAVFWLFPNELLGAFGVADETVLNQGTTLLKYLAFSGLFMASSLAITGGLHGAGDTVSPMIIALITYIGFLLGLCWLFSAIAQLTAGAIWFAILTNHITRFLLIYRTFQRGKWAGIHVELEA
jgi:putative MATE family efflux protein